VRSRGLVELNARDYPAAKRSIGEALKLNPEMGSANGWLGDIAHLEGDHQAALAFFEKEPSTLNRLRGFAIVHHALGNSAEAQKALADMRERYGTNSLYQEAEIYAQWGDVDRAISALDAAYKEGDSGLVLAKNDPLLDPLRKDSRFAALLGRIGFR
jgi:tetratricopeptide (TPR) repeat protein